MQNVLPEERNVTWTLEELEQLGNLNVSLNSLRPQPETLRPTRPPPLPPQLPARYPSTENLTRQEEYNRIVSNIEAREAQRRLDANLASVQHHNHCHLLAPLVKPLVGYQDHMKICQN